MGVVAKYLQQYLNWYRMDELLKGSPQLVNEFSIKTKEDIKAIKKFKQIDDEYQKLIINTIVN